jgi:hypothetical protein
MKRERRYEVLRKILIGMACLGVGTLFLACQSDNGATGPGIQDDVDESYPIWGYVFDEFGSVANAGVLGFDYDAPPPPNTRFGPVATDYTGKYQFGSFTHLKYREGHTMRLYAVKGTKSGWTDYFTWDGSTVRIDIYIE